MHFPNEQVAVGVHGTVHSQEAVGQLLMKRSESVSLDSKFLMY